MPISATCTTVLKDFYPTGLSARMALRTWAQEWLAPRQTTRRLGGWGPDSMLFRIFFLLFFLAPAAAFRFLFFPSFFPLSFFFAAALVSYSVFLARSRGFPFCVFFPSFFLLFFFFFLLPRLSLFRLFFVFLSAVYFLVLLRVFVLRKLNKLSKNSVSEGFELGTIVNY